MNIKKTLAENLTDEQLSAVLDDKKNILCLACAGSGKSRTLAYRIAYLVANGCPPESIVAFTFTDKAAESIKRRVSEALSKCGQPSTLIGAMYIGTIHAYCQHLLGCIDASYRQFEVLDENGLKLYLLSRYYDLGLNQIQKEKASHMFSTISEVSNAWSIANDEDIDYGAIENEDATLGKLLKRIYSYLHREQYIDFSLMIRLTVDELVKDTPTIRMALSNVKHILVDEYQDVNPAQERLIRQLRKKAESLMVVGDDDQSIYAWRGADVNNILTFEKRYDNSSVHILNTNFRSTNAIVQASDLFIRQELSTARYSKKPVAKSNSNINDFRSLWFETRDKEAQWVAQRIKSLLGTKYVEYNSDGSIREERGLTPADFAILFRSIRRRKNPKNLPQRSYEFINALKKLNIPYSLESEGGIFERPYAVAIRDTMELLRNPNPLRENVLSLFNSEILPYFPNANFNELTHVLSNWNVYIYSPTSAARRKVYPQKFLHQILHAFGVQKTSFDDGVLRDLGVFSRIMLDIEKVFVSIDSSGRYKDVLNFLSNVAESGYDVSTLDVVARPDTVTVSTIHKMNGLEYPVVFIVDVVDRRFPAAKSSYSGWLPKKLMRTPIQRGAYVTTRQDEARLFYTAMTRAERFLYITGSAKQPDTLKPKKPSVFKIRIDQMGVCIDANIPKDLEYIAPKRSIDEEILPTSYSDIKEYLICPMSYKLKKLLGFSPSVPELFGFGLTTHTIIERLHQQFKLKPPTKSEIDNLIRKTFHLKHIFPSQNSNPGPYERAYNSATKITQNYVATFGDDFKRLREDEARFEITIGQALVSGAIDLLLKHDDKGKILGAQVIDFKSINAPGDISSDDWIDLSLQVQLYAYAATTVLGEQTKTGSVHLLREKGRRARVNIPIGKDDIDAALDNVSWAVERILNSDFPMRPCSGKCEKCDVRLICHMSPQPFKTGRIPLPVSVPTEEGKIQIKAFSEFEKDFSME